MSGANIELVRDVYEHWITAELQAPGGVTARSGRSPPPAG
jgi:hypothetical protein